MKENPFHNHRSQIQSLIKKTSVITLALCLTTTQSLYAKEENFISTEEEKTEENTRTEQKEDKKTEESFIEESDETEFIEEVQPTANDSSKIHPVLLTPNQIQQYVPKINLDSPEKTLGAKNVELLLEGIEELKTRSTLSRQLKQYPLVVQLESLDKQQRQALKDKLLAIQPYMESQPVHSIYNPNTGEHLLSMDQNEVHDLRKMGWRNEGIIFGNSVKNGVPVYRFYQKSTGLHRYTSKAQEIAELKASGWQQDNTIFYASSLNGQEVYQIQHPTNKRIALTPDPVERATLLQLGWIDLGVAFKVVPYADLVVQQKNNQTTLKAYDSQGNPIEGTLKLRVQSLYFDPKNEGVMSSGYIDVLNEKQTGEHITDSCYRLYLNDGTMATGEQQVNNQIHYFDLGDGHMIKDKMIRYGADQSAYYYDANGNRFSGKMEYKGRVLEFDENGKLKQDAQKLFNRLTQYIQANKKPNETYSLALRLPDQGEQYLWNNGVQQSASTMKLFVMGAIYENYETYIQRYGKSTIDRSLHAMITVSDNESWKYLTSILGEGSYARGVEVLTSWCKQHGYNQTRMENRAYGNFTSVHDSSKILQDIYLGKLKHSQAMENLICQQRVPGRLLAGIPAGVKTGNKAGWLSNTSNDSVIVWLDDGVYILSLMATNIVDYNNCLNIMKTISNQTYLWMKENYEGTIVNPSVKATKEASNEVEKEKLSKSEPNNQKPKIQQK